MNITRSDGSTALEGYTSDGNNTFQFLSGGSISPPLALVASGKLQSIATNPTKPMQSIGLVSLVQNWDYNGQPRSNEVIAYTRFNRTSGLWVPNSSNEAATLVLSSAGPAGVGGPNNTGTGSHWLVVSGSYYLLYAYDMFAMDPTSGEPVGGFTVARSLLTDGGKPGTWTRYYRDEWSEPGVGGNADALTNLIGAKMVYLEQYGLWLAVGDAGSMSVSEDGLAWSLLPSQVFPPTPAGQCTQFFTQPNVYGFASLVPGLGGTVLQAGDNLYVYYMFNVATNASWAAGPRGLASAQLTFTANSEPAPQPLTTLSFATYVWDAPSAESEDVHGGGLDLVHGLGSGEQPHNLRGAKQDFWATVTAVDQSVYNYGWHLGLTLATPGDWTDSPLVSLTDCYAVERNDHYVALDGECVNPSPQGVTMAYLGGLGYILADNSTAVPGFQMMPLWRCFNPLTQDSYVNPEDGCRPTDTNQTMLGFMLWQND
jgi:hypothetical protein